MINHYLYCKECGQFISIPDKKCIPQKHHNRFGYGCNKPYPEDLYSVVYIQTINHIRALTGKSIKESKEIVDNILKKENQNGRD